MIIHSLHTSRSPTSCMNAPISARAAHKLRYRPGYMAALVLKFCTWKYHGKTHEKLGEDNGTTMGKKTSMEKPVENTMESHPTEAKGLEKVMRVALSWVPTSTPAHNQTEVKTHLKPLEVWELLNVNTHLAYFHLSICSICMLSFFIACFFLVLSPLQSLSFFLPCVHSFLFFSLARFLLAFFAFLLFCFLASLFSWFFLLFSSCFLFFPLISFYAYMSLPFLSFLSALSLFLQLFQLIKS